MRVVFQSTVLACLLAAWVSAEEVQITVFTLKDGTELEAISHASAMQEGESVHSVTTTDGDKKVLWGNEIVRKRNVTKNLADLPEYARKKLDSQRKAQEGWTTRAAAEREAEEQKRKTALLRASEMADEGRALREATAEEQTVRQRCATLWDAQQAALARARAAQTAGAQAQTDYQDATDDLRSLDRWRPRTPEETTRWRFLRQRAQRLQDSAQDAIRQAEQTLQQATNQANQFAAQLAQAKAELAQAQQRTAEAQQRYNEARERFKQPATLSDPTGEKIAPIAQETDKPVSDAPAGGAPAPALRSTVVRSIENGEFVQLADGSLWEIHPEDRAASSRWLAEQEIVIVNGNDPTYAHRLVNNVTRMAVKARKLK